MSITFQTDPLLLREDTTGDLRVGRDAGSRGIGASRLSRRRHARAIAQRYPSLSLADVYSVVAYYLRHRDAMERYLADRERQADDVRQRIDRPQRDLTYLRNRLLRQRNQ